MSCSRIKRELSEYMDGELSGPALHAVSAHLEACGGCTRHLGELQRASEMLAGLALLTCPEPLASGVSDRLEVESRGPGLALLFRSAWTARPLMVPSVAPAALVLVATLGSVLMLGARDLRIHNQSAQGYNLAHASGTNAEPLSPNAGASGPRTASDIFMDYELARMPDHSLFVEAVVARDGRVLNLFLLDGDSGRAAPILKEMRYQRYVPGRSEEGYPVAMRTYRLFDSVEVRAPLT